MVPITKTWRLRSACVAVLAGGLFLLQTGAAAADTQPPPNPEKLWEAFPLDPQTTTPAPPSPAAEPADPTPPPQQPRRESNSDTRWNRVVAGGLAGALLLVASAGLLRARARRRPEPAPTRPQSTEELIARAYALAKEVRRETMAYDSDTRAAVGAYAIERRRDAEQQVQKQLADAEVQARATREAAEEMARQIEEDGRQRGHALREESRAVEERLKKALFGLRRMTVELEELVGTPAAQTDGESLADALKPYGQRDEEMQPLVEER